MERIGRSVVVSMVMYTSYVFTGGEGAVRSRRGVCHCSSFNEESAAKVSLPAQPFLSSAKGYQSSGGAKIKTVVGVCACVSVCVRVLLRSKRRFRHV